MKTCILGVLYEAVKKALRADHVRSSVCLSVFDLVSATTVSVTLQLNSV